MKKQYIQPLTLTIVILAALFFLRAFLPQPKLNAGLTVQSGSYPAGVGSSSGYPETGFRGQY